MTTNVNGKRSRKATICAATSCWAGVPRPLSPMTANLMENVSAGRASHPRGCPSVPRVWTTSGGVAGALPPGRSHPAAATTRADARARALVREAFVVELDTPLTQWQATRLFMRVVCQTATQCDGLVNASSSSAIPVHHVRRRCASCPPLLGRCRGNFRRPRSRAELAPSAVTFHSGRFGRARRRVRVHDTGGQ